MSGKDKNIFGARLRELRLRAGFTLRDLAEKINVSFTYLSKIENGALPPPSEKVIRLLAETLNVDKDELLSLAGIIPADIAEILQDNKAREQLRSGVEKPVTAARPTRATSQSSENESQDLKPRLSPARVALAVLLTALVGTLLWLAVPNTESAIAMNNQGVTYNEQGEYEKAIEQFNQALEIDPELAIAYSNRAWAYLDLRQYEKAITDCDKALELDPSLALAYSNRGLAYIRLGQYQQGINDCTKAIKYDPELAIAYSNRGLAYAELGELDKAIADFDMAITLDPSLQN